MKVAEIMTREVCVASPTDTIRKAAELMAGLDIGALPVGENDRLIGVITDRDIAIRGVAQGAGPEAQVGDVMTHDVRYCFDNEDVEDVALNLGEIQVRRVPVVNQDKRLVGIVSLSDVALRNRGGAAEALEGISRPGGFHN
jgi:CBS domain-containing protein